MPILELFSEGRFWPTLITSCGIFCLLLLAYLLNSWTPTIAVKAGLAPATAALCGVFLNLGGVIGALLSIPAGRRFGVFKVAAVMVGIGSPAIALIGHLFASAGTLFGALFVAGVLVIGGQQNSPAMSVLLYPRRMRAAGAGWQFGVGRLGSIVGPVIGGYLLAAAYPAHFLFLLMAIPAVLAAVCYAVVGRLRAALARRPSSNQRLHTDLHDSPRTSAPFDLGSPRCAPLRTVGHAIPGDPAAIARPAGHAGPHERW